MPKDLGRIVLRYTGGRPGEGLTCRGVPAKGLTQQMIADAAVYGWDRKSLVASRAYVPVVTSKSKKGRSDDEGESTKDESKSKSGEGDDS